MRNIILIIAVFLALATLPARAGTQWRSTASGMWIATGTGQQLSFYGAQPITQPTASTQVALADSTGGAILGGTLVAVTPLRKVTIVTSSTINARLAVSGILPGDTVIGAITVNGASSVDASADFETVISGTATILQTGTSTGTGNKVAIYIGRTENNTANTARLVNAIRTALVNLGLMKGGG